MSTIAAALRPIPVPKPETLRRDPAAQAFMLLAWRLPSRRSHSGSTSSPR
jgi:hypothetical protein